MPTGWNCTGFTAATCGFAADWVSGVNPGTLIDPPPAPDPNDMYRAGAVMFRITGAGQFEVWLSNISDLDTLDAVHLLTAVVFDIGDGTTDNADLVSLTRVNATLASDASITNAGLCSSGECVGATDVSSEWAYQQLVSPYPNGPAPGAGPHYGISSTGLGIFAPSDLFGMLSKPGVDKKGNPITIYYTLDDPDNPDGPNFGIATVGDNPLTGSGNLLDRPNIKSGAAFGGVVFRFTYTGDLDVRRINNVLFQYGTALDEGFTWPDCVVPQPGDAINARGGEECTPVCTDCGGNEVPEPASLILVGSGFIGLAGFLRRKLT
jgi:hypothetical protein